MSNVLMSKLMSVKIDSSTLGYTTNFSLSLGQDLIEIVYLGSGKAKENVPDMSNWSVSGSGLVFKTLSAGMKGAFDIANNIISTSDASIAVQIIPDASSVSYFSGVGYFSSLSLEGGVGAPVTYSFEITGTGNLSVLTTT